MKIGVFDSGFGGLTVLKELRAALPQHDYLYLGDNARTPYGDRSPEIIREFTRQCVEYLFRHKCQLVIIACNTASAHALEYLQNEWLPKHFPDRQLMGVITPTIEWISHQPASKKIGIIGTRATISSNTYQRALVSAGSPHEIVAIPCPLLVPLIEEGWHQSVSATMILKKYLRPLKLAKVDILVLGCTHYPLLFKKIERLMGARTTVLNPAQVVAQSVANFLETTSNTSSKNPSGGSIHFITTDNSEKFRTLATRFWGSAIESRAVKVDSSSES